MGSVRRTYMSKLPMWNLYGFRSPARDQQGACTIILKAHQGSYTSRPICDPYGPVRLSTGRLRAKIVRSPCLKVRHAQLSATGYTAPVRIETYFKDCAGPHSMPIHHVVRLSRGPHGSSPYGTCKLPGSLM